VVIVVLLSSAMKYTIGLAWFKIVIFIYIPKCLEFHRKIINVRKNMFSQL